jgi:hypothetical protein
MKPGPGPHIWSGRLTSQAHDPKHTSKYNKYLTITYGQDGLN